MPGLAERREDIEPNLDYELDRFAEREGERVSFNKEARARYLAFATAPEARWPGNFRDLAASVTRMATFRPRAASTSTASRPRSGGSDGCGRASAGAGSLAVLLAEEPEEIDPFDRVQLAETVRICRASRSLSEAGRTLFAASRTRRSIANDADRLRKYLARFGLDWFHVIDGV